MATPRKSAHSRTGLSNRAFTSALSNVVVCFPNKKYKVNTWSSTRLLVGGVKSFVGEIPLGNSGGANVPPLKPMEIPSDLREILSAYQN